MRDGEIDYSGYELLELEEALAKINKQQYPKNYANLHFAYEQLTASIAETTLPETSATIGVTTRASYWARLCIRPVCGLLGAFYFWSAYRIFAQPDSCVSERRLMGFVMNAICEEFGHVVTAGIPFALGLILVAAAVVPRRRSGS